MDDPLNAPDPDLPEESADPGAALELKASPEPVANPATPIAAEHEAPGNRRADVAAFYADAELRRRGFRHNLFLLLGFTLAAFILASWILVRSGAPFGMSSTGPQEIVRAQLRALDRGELRPAYDMFSAHYREQVSFDTWHELFITHWRMFHADVLRAEPPSQSGPGVTLEIHLHGSDDKEYRARFTLIRTDGRWWIDDVHWTQEPDQGQFSRT